MEVKVREECVSFYCIQDGENCPLCRGTKWVERWVPIKELLADVLNLNFPR